MLKLGIVLIFGSVILFVIAMVAPDSLRPLAPLFCQSGEQLTSAQTTFSIPGETSTSDSFACEDAEGNQRDITDQVMDGSIVVYLIFLFLGVGLTIFGSARKSKSNETSWDASTPQPQISRNSGGSAAFSYSGASSDPVSGAVMNDRVAGARKGVIRFGGQEIHVDDLKSGNYQLDAAQGKRTLAETLHQLEDAHTQGLISNDEYQKLRQDALDKLV